MIKKLLEKLYNLLDLIFYQTSREVLETEIEGLKMKLIHSEDALAEAMVDIEDYKDEISSLKGKRWIS